MVSALLPFSVVWRARPLTHLYPFLKCLRYSILRHRVETSRRNMSQDQKRGEREGLQDDLADDAPERVQEEG